MSFPGRRRPFLVVAAMLGAGMLAGLAAAAIGQPLAGLLVAAVFAALLFPVLKRGLDSGPALTFDDAGVDASAAGVRVPWGDVTEVRYEGLSAPGTGGRGFLVLGLGKSAEPNRTGPLAPRPRETDDGGREVWISLSGIDAPPAEIFEAARRMQR